MRVRHVFALAALSLLLSACGADAITAPEAQSPTDRRAYGGVGWAGGGGAVPTKPTSEDSAS